MCVDREQSESDPTTPHDDLKLLAGGSFALFAQLRRQGLLSAQHNGIAAAPLPVEASAYGTATAESQHRSTSQAAFAAAASGAGTLPPNASAQLHGLSAVSITRLLPDEIWSHYLIHPNEIAQDWRQRFVSSKPTQRVLHFMVVIGAQHPEQMALIQLSDSQVHTGCIATPCSWLSSHYVFLFDLQKSASSWGMGSSRCVVQDCC